MTSSEILLVVISGLGVIHGLFLAIFLWIYPKGNKLSNQLLSFLLIVLSFRVGKSVFLEFATDMDIRFIFIGLGTIMAIGPLFYFFTRSSIDKAFQFQRKYLLHFIPALIGICFGFFVDEQLTETLPGIFFLFLFVSYYGHYLAYLLMSNSRISKAKNEGLNANTVALLRLLFWGLFAVWIVYVLNLFDEFIPYIVGPILYTLVAYVISFIVIQKGYIKGEDKVKYKTTPVADEQVKQVFSKVLTLVADEKLFTNPDLSLNLLSEKLKVSKQVLSMAINKESKTNFNRFINQYRIEEAKKIFGNEAYQNHTIASIAFEVGFNSLSSFNSAFKKQTSQTPLAYRKKLSK